MFSRVLFCSDTAHCIFFVFILKVSILSVTVRQCPVESYRALDEDVANAFGASVGVCSVQVLILVGAGAGLFYVGAYFMKGLMYCN